MEGPTLALTASNPNMGLFGSSGSNPAITGSTAGMTASTPNPLSQSASSVSIVGLQGQAPPSRAGLKIALALGVVAALGIGGWAITRSSSSANTASSAKPTDTAPVATTAALTTPTAPAATTAAPTLEQIVLSVSATPKESTVYVDDEKAEGNPIEQKVSKDGQIHIVRVEADGYLPKVEKVVFDGTKSLSIKLDRAPAHWIPPPKKPDKPQPTVSTPPPPPPATTAAPPPPPAATGTKARPIDTDNPFAK
jgi:hypothetical protein